MAGKADRKLYVAALGVAVAGLGLDRVMFSGDVLSPRTASAAQAEAQSLEPAPVGPGMAGGVGGAGAAESTTLLADRLKIIERERGLDPLSVRNVFWLEGVSAQPGAPGAAEAAKAIEAFKSTHRLRTVMSGAGGGGGGFVVVGERRLEIGQSLDGFELVAITVDRMRPTAVFKFNGHTVALTMDAPKLAGSGGEPQGGGGGGR